MERKGWTVRIGEACVLSLGVAAFTAIPTALRTASAGGAFATGLLAAVAVLLPPVVLSILLARAAERGFRAIVGATPRRVVAFGLALWISISVSMLAFVARVLKAHTHHRGLGGATFALTAIVVVILAAAASHRLLAVGQTLVARGTKPWIPAAIASAIAVAPLLVMAAPLAAHGGGQRAPEVRASLVDGAIAVVAIALVASVQLGERVGRISTTWGVPITAVLVIAGIAHLESSPQLSHALRAGGGLPATLLGVVEDLADHGASPAPEASVSAATDAPEKDAPTRVLGYLARLECRAPSRIPRNR